MILKTSSLSFLYTQEQLVPQGFIIPLLESVPHN